MCEGVTPNNPTKQVVHVQWWDNFSKCYAYQKQDLARTNFALCLWTVVGVQRQSLPTQPHVLSSDPSVRGGLLSVADFTIKRNSSPALPDDLLDSKLIDGFKKEWLGPVDRIKSFWTSHFRAKNVTRVPLKLPPVDDDKSQPCPRCGTQRCSCFMQEILSAQSEAEATSLLQDTGKNPLHVTDDISGSPDGMLNFFPRAMKEFNIGSKAGLARMLAEFHIENRNSQTVKIVNTDVQIYERIMKVRTKTLHCQKEDCRFSCVHD